MVYLWAELINSDWRDYRGSGKREDRLENQEWLHRFAASAGWIGKRRMGKSEREALGKLRDILRRMVGRIRRGSVVSNRDLRAFNRVLDGFSTTGRLTQGDSGWSLATVPGAGGIAQVLGVVAASFAATLTEGEPERIKVCDNPDCGWVIYDESRNRSRRWCDVTECGNLIKVRQHRKRKREARAPDLEVAESDD
jgi:predicted RNA-binding Zn ribbon-like protein